MGLIQADINPRLVGCQVSWVDAVGAGRERGGAAGVVLDVIEEELGSGWEVEAERTFREGGELSRRRRCDVGSIGWSKRDGRG